MIEAAMAGIPVVSHPHSGAQFILEDVYWLTNMDRAGSLTAKLMEIRSQGVAFDKLAALQTNAYARFSSQALVHQFVEMVTKVAYM